MTRERSALEPSGNSRQITKQAAGLLRERPSLARAPRQKPMMPAACFVREATRATEAKAPRVAVPQSVAANNVVPGPDNSGPVRCLGSDVGARPGA